MKSALVLAIVCLAGTWADESLLRVKKDLASKRKVVCVLADVSKTGKKTVVCGDPAPPTLEALLAEKSETTVAAAAAAAAVATNANGQTEARTPTEKCFGKKQQSVSVFVQQPTHYAQPQIQYVQQQPQQVHCEQQHIQVMQPQVHLVQPQVHLVQPQVHYEQAQVHYMQPVSKVHPIKACLSSLCGGDQNEGGYYGRSVMGAGYPTVVRAVAENGGLRAVDELGPYEETLTLARDDGRDWGDFRRFAPASPSFRTVLMRAAVDDLSPSGEYDGDVQQSYPTMQNYYGGGGSSMQQPSFDQDVVLQERSGYGRQVAGPRRQQYGYLVRPVVQSQNQLRTSDVPIAQNELNAGGMKYVVVAEDAQNDEQSSYDEPSSAKLDSASVAKPIKKTA